MNNIMKIKRLQLTTNQAEEVSYNEMLDQISFQHRQENNHSGIDKTYNDLKHKVYYPNLKLHITKFINNCIICKYKYERKPIKLPYEKTETPLGPHLVYHADIWFPSAGLPHLTVIDKFTKYAFVEEIPDRNSLSVLKALTKIFVIMKTPKKLITDNDPGFSNGIITDYLEKKGVELHLTTPYRHTGNSDIEIFHRNLNEHIRIFKAREQYKDIAYNYDLTLQALEAYNNTTHGTTGKKPIELQFSSSTDFADIY